MSDDTGQSVEKLQSELQQLDEQLQDLLQRRLLLCHQLIASETDLPDPTSQTRTVQHLVERNRQVSSGHPVQFGSTAIERLFTEISAECREVCRPLVVAYLGPEGTYTQAAAFKHFGQAAETRPYTAIDDVFRAVETGECPIGIVPVENSIEGTINRTLDRISDSPLGICGEVTLRIEHNLLGNAELVANDAAGSSLANVKVVHAHPQALAQCRMWLDANLPAARRVAASSNAAGAELAVKDPACVAIASATAAEIYNLEVLASNIEDNVSNTTRFIVVGAFEPVASGNDVTSLVVSAPHRPGGLRKMLEPFESAGVSMSRIESRPSRSELWSYVFFIDVSGHRSDPVLAEALVALSTETRFMRILGSYPTVRH